MIAIRRVLCPTDLSDVSEQALDYALDFARWFEAGVTLLHAVPPLPVMLGATGVVPPPPTSGEAERRRAMEALVASRATGGAPPIDAEIVTGEPARQIVARARQLRADLLVAGTHGRRGLPRWLLGSVAEELLRTAPCPLLVVPPSAESPPRPLPELLRRLVCAVDFSDASLRAVELAFALAKESDARVLLVHVLEALPPPVAALAPAPPPVVLGHMDDLRARAVERLARVVPEGAGEWCEPGSRVSWGKPWREIVRLAAEHEAGLVVMGAHGHGALDRLFFGSTAEAVVRHAGCPVLVTRDSRAEPPAV